MGLGWLVRHNRRCARSQGRRIANSGCLKVCPLLALSGHTLIHPAFGGKEDMAFFGANVRFLTQSGHTVASTAGQGDVSRAQQRSRGSDCTSHDCLPLRSADILRLSDIGNPNGRLLWSPRTKGPQRLLPAMGPTLTSDGDNGENRAGHRYAPWSRVGTNTGSTVNIALDNLVQCRVLGAKAEMAITL